jgi:hypothetical protein
MVTIRNKIKEVVNENAIERVEKVTSEIKDITPLEMEIPFNERVQVPTIEMNLGEQMSGWVFGSNALSKGKVRLFSDEEKILLGDATSFAEGKGIFIGKVGDEYVFRVGDPDSEYFSYDGTSFDGGVPTHKASHQKSGSDEISVANLSGLLADGQTPLGHKTSHQKSGSDEISVTNLSGKLADAQTPLSHNTTHDSAGSDSLNIIYKLATISGIDAKIEAATTLYTVPVGKTAIITGAIIIVADDDTATGEPNVSIGFDATFDNLFADTALTGLLETGDVWHFVSSGLSIISPAESIIKISINTGATATKLELNVTLLGYLI